MAVTLALHFPAGRYHATPWDHHVNEGLIEWPPSPWRLLRALVSVGYTSGVWNGSGLPPVARQLVAKLAAELPKYHLPPLVGSHSRHYMPMAALDKGREKTTLVFDTWARVGEELTVTWKVDLSDEEFAMLTKLVERLGYLGRSESWVLGRVISGRDEAVPQSNCYPEQTGVSPGPGWEQIALLAPVDADVFERWRSECLCKVLAGLPLLEGKEPTRKLLRDRKKAIEPFPADLLDCLQKDTNWLRRHGWSHPPGSRRVFYWRKADAIKVGFPKARKRTRTEPVEAMLLSLTNASRNDHALPPVTRTLPQAELLHKALIDIAAKNGVPPAVLTGCDDEGNPLKSAHKHAHINPLDLDGDGHLDHILIWASMGLDADAQVAIRSVRRTFTKGGIEPLRLALAASGDLMHLIRLPKPYGRHLGQIVAVDGAKVWQSSTPFVPPRFIKARGKNTLEGQVRAELRSRGFPEPISVQQLAPSLRPLGKVRLQRAVAGDIPEGHDPDWARLRHFILSRRSGPQPPIRCGFAVRIEFDQPIENRLVSLGYASHFGMGLFCRG